VRERNNATSRKNTANLRNWFPPAWRAGLGPPIFILSPSIPFSHHGDRPSETATKSLSECRRLKALGGAEIPRHVLHIVETQNIGYLTHRQISFHQQPRDLISPGSADFFQHGPVQRASEGFFQRPA